MRRPLSLAEFGGCGLRERLVRSSVRCTKRAPTSSDSRRRYVVVVASAGIPAGFFEIGPLSRASRRAKVPSVANVEESVVEATLCTEGAAQGQRVTHVRHVSSPLKSKEQDAYA